MTQSIKQKWLCTHSPGRIPIAVLNKSIGFNIKPSWAQSSSAAGTQVLPKQGPARAGSFPKSHSTGQQNNSDCVRLPNNNLLNNMSPETKAAPTNSN